MKVYVPINKDGKYLTGNIIKGASEATKDIEKAQTSNTPFVSGVPWDAVECICVEK